MRLAFHLALAAARRLLWREKAIALTKGGLNLNALVVVRPRKTCDGFL
jgi:hypothetical protein